MKIDGTVKQTKAGAKETCISTFIFLYARKKNEPAKGQCEITRHQVLEEWPGTVENRGRR